MKLDIAGSLPAPALAEALEAAKQYFLSRGLCAAKCFNHYNDCLMDVFAQHWVEAQCIVNRLLDSTKCTLIIMGKV